MPTQEELYNQARLAAALKVAIEEARSSTIGLYKLLFSADDGSAIFVKDFHYEWDRICSLRRSALIQAPRGSSKTTFILAFILKELGNQPNIRIKCISEAKETAEKRLRAVREYISENPLWPAVFPNCTLDLRKHIPNNNNQLTLVRDITTPEPSFEAKGVLSSAVGGRTDILILDDICGHRNTLLNPATRKQVVSKLQSDWLPTLAKGGFVISIHTPWHREDANAYLANNTNWERSYHAHGRAGDPYYSIFPELYPPERLREIHKEEGDVHYARGYLCKLTSSETAVILPDHLQDYDTTTLTPAMVETATATLAIDPASGRDLHKGKLDHTGVCVSLFNHVPGGDPPYQISIPEAFQIRLPAPRQVELIAYLAQIWQVSRILVEAQGMQNLHEWLWADPRINSDIVQPVQTRNLSKGMRLTEVASLFQQIDVTGQPCLRFHPRVIQTNPEPHLVEVLDWQEFATRDFRDQILSFPTTHDDILDAVVYNLKYIKDHLIGNAHIGKPGERATIEVLSTHQKRATQAQSMKQRRLSATEKQALKDREMLDQLLRADHASISVTS